MNAHLFWACFRIFIITGHQNTKGADPREPRPAQQTPANDDNQADDGKFIKFCVEVNIRSEILWEVIEITCGDFAYSCTLNRIETDYYVTNWMISTCIDVLFGNFFFVSLSLLKISIYPCWMSPGPRCIKLLPEFFTAKTQETPSIFFFSIAICIKLLLWPCWTGGSLK